MRLLFFQVAAIPRFAGAASSPMTERKPPDGTYRRFVGLVLPVYDSGVKRPGDFMWNLFGGLVGHERIGHHQFMRLFWLFTFETGPAPRAQTAWYSAPPRTSRKVAARGLNVAGF